MRGHHLILGGIILVGAGRAWAAEPAPTDDARRAFQAGVILLKDPDGAKYEEALSQFNRAYQLSSSWKVLGNIGLCSLKLERDGEAITAYEKYLAQGSKEIEADERAQVERDLAALKAQVVRVRVQVPAGSSRLTDERTSAHGTRIVNDYPLAGTSAEIGLHPGQHVITLRLAKGDAKWEVKLDPATTVSHAFEGGEARTAAVVPESHEVHASSNGARTIGFVVGGAGVVGLGIGTYFGLRTFSKKGDSDAYCTGTQCDPQGLTLRDEAKSAATISNIAFAAGVAGTAVGAYLVFFSGSGAKSGSGLALGSTVAAGRTDLMLRGAW